MDSGTLTRNLPTPTIYVPSTSQFYSKTVAHENRHVYQWQQGLLSDLLQVPSLMAVLSPLTGTTQADLSNKIAAAFTNWFNANQATYNSRIPAAETDAHAVSDLIVPQYLYQKCN